MDSREKLLFLQKDLGLYNAFLVVLDVGYNACESDDRAFVETSLKWVDDFDDNLLKTVSP